MSIPFIQSVNGKFRVSDEAKKVLSNVQGKIAVVCVAGPYRTGKSFLLNSLIGQGSAFQVGETVRACTKGIWMWGKPIRDPKSGVSFVFLDSEGLGSVDQDGHFDTHIFSLALLLSSLFVLNTHGTINEGALEQLELVVECSQRIRVEESGGSTGELSKHFPDFLWVLRDFVLEMVDDNGNSITSKQYLEGCLGEQKEGKNSESKNRIRQTIKTVFANRECFTMVRPMTDERKLRKMHALDPSDMRPEFRQQLDTLKQMVWSSARVKTLGKHNVNGAALVGLAEAYTDAMNKGAIPTISSAWDSVVEVQCTQALDAATSAFANHLTQSTNNQVLDEEEMEAVVKAAQKLGLDIIRQRAIGDDEKKAMVEEDFACRTEEPRKTAVSMNALRARENNSTLIEKLWAQSGVEKRWTGYNTMADFSNDRDAITKLFLSKAKGPGKEEVAAKFLGKKCDALGVLFAERARSLQAELQAAKDLQTRTQNSLDKAQQHADTARQEAKAEVTKLEKANAAVNEKLEASSKQNGTLHTQNGTLQAQITTLTQQLHQAALSAQDGEHKQAERITLLDTQLKLATKDAEAARKQAEEAVAKLKDYESTISKLEKKEETSKQKLAHSLERQAKDIQEREKLLKDFEQSAARCEALDKRNQLLSSELSALKKRSEEKDSEREAEKESERAKEKEKVKEYNTTKQSLLDKCQQLQEASSAREKELIAEKEKMEARLSSTTILLQQTQEDASTKAKTIQELESRLAAAVGGAEGRDKEIQAVNKARQEVETRLAESEEARKALSEHSQQLALWAKQQETELQKTLKARESALEESRKESKALSTRASELEAALSKALLSAVDPQEQAELAEKNAKLNAQVSALKQQLETAADEKMTLDGKLVKAKLDLLLAQEKLAEKEQQEKRKSIALAQPIAHDHSISLPSTQTQPQTQPVSSSEQDKRKSLVLASESSSDDDHPSSKRQTTRRTGDAPKTPTTTTTTTAAPTTVKTSTPKTPTAAAPKTPLAPSTSVESTKKGSKKTVIKITPGKRKQSLGLVDSSPLLLSSQEDDDGEAQGTQNSQSDNGSSQSEQNHSQDDIENGSQEQEDKENGGDANNNNAEADDGDDVECIPKHKKMVQDRRRRKSLKLPAADELVDPAKKTIKDLKAWLTELDVELPTVTKQKQYYVDLLYKYEPLLEGRCPPSVTRPKRK